MKDHKNQTFHFTLGPVQGFVAQARRTRDLWAGSFLLSWLSGHAVKAVLDQGGDIVFPAVTDESRNPVDPLLIAIMGKIGHDSPQIGSIPNRFKASVDDAFDPKKVGEAIQTKWKELADAVYEKFVKPVANDNTNQIWKRQINNFWEINWVIGENPGDHSDDRWLDMRKNWRSHWPGKEGGDHCTIMGDFQELSGYFRAKNWEEQNSFWAKIRVNKALDDYLDIRENERLCAIALVKRLFPRLGENKLIETIGWIPGGKKNAVANWPSTTYMAIAPWLQHIADDKVRIELLDDYVTKVVKTVPRGYFKKLASERATHLVMLTPLKEKRNTVGSCQLDDVDGDILHIHALRNHRTTYLSDGPLDKDGKDNNEKNGEKLVKALDKLYRDIGKNPRSYYALLLMDGDHLGKMLQEENQAAVSRALLDFTGQVQPCVDKQEAHSGVTIYAGGDDVFALLPMDRAIVCAQALRRIFSECFLNERIHATASCAIVFAHHQVPLRSVIREAHRQLEGVAKDQNGRDSLALAIYKPGGITAQWVSTWEKEPSPVDRLRELIQCVDNGEYPRGFFHKLRDRYGFYEDQGRAASPDSLDIQKLLVSEYMQSRDPTPKLSEAEKAAERLQAACKPLARDERGKTKPSATLKLDGGFIARFLTQEED